jgi:hypothetical protein
MIDADRMRIWKAFGFNEEEAEEIEQSPLMKTWREAREEADRQQEELQLFMRAWAADLSAKLTAWLNDARG